MKKEKPKRKRRPKGQRKISIAASKQKARLLQQWIEKKIGYATGLDCGKDTCIQSREMGQSGVDVKLIKDALKLYPFSIEAKNQESWSIPAFIKQAKANQIEGTDWQLFVKKNHHEQIVVMDAAVWFEIWKELLELREYAD